MQVDRLEMLFILWGTIGWTGLVIRAELPRALQHEDVVPKSALKFNVIHQYH